MSKTPILNFAILCDQVLIENGKYTFKGLFECINATTFPAIHNSCYIITRWGQGVGDGYKQNIIIRIEDTKDIVFDSSKLENDFSLPSLESTHTIVGNIAGLFLRKEGAYVVEVYLNGVKQETVIRFTAQKTKLPIENRIATLLQRS